MPPIDRSVRVLKFSTEATQEFHFHALPSSSSNIFDDDDDDDDVDPFDEIRKSANDTRPNTSASTFATHTTNTARSDTSTTTAFRGGKQHIIYSNVSNLINDHVLFIFFKKTTDIFAKRFTALEHAVLYFKPFCNADGVMCMVEDRLKAQGVSIVYRGVLTGTDIAHKRIFEKQYSILIKFSTQVSAVLLDLSAEACDLFRQTFTREFSHVKANLPIEEPPVDGAAPSHSVKKNLPLKVLFNFNEAQQYLHIDNAELNEMCLSEHSVSVRLGKGLYCYRFEKDCTSNLRVKGLLPVPIYVVNPFFGALHDRYTAQNTAVQLWVVEWDANIVSWSSLLRDIIGERDPSKAAEHSIRRMVFETWLELGLKEAPDAGRNVLHISHSALEGLAERLAWTRNAMVFTDLFGSRLMTARCTTAQIMQWLANPSLTVTVEEDVLVDDGVAAEGSVRRIPKSVQKPLFDVLHEKNSEECINYLVKLSKP